MMDVKAGESAEQKESLTNENQGVSEEWKAWLWKYNLIAGCLHLGQAIMQLVLGLTIENFRNFKLPVRLNYLSQLTVPGTDKQYLGLAYTVWGDVPIAPFVAIFFFLSAIAHFTVLWNKDAYFAQLARGTNKFRWWEYAFSSSFMIVLIAQLFGCYDIASLFLIFVSNFATQFTGLLMEEMNDLSKPDLKINWTPFYVGCLTGFAPWVATAFYFFGSGPSPDIPGFVYGVFVSYFIFFNTFPLNMILQYKKVGKWAEYLYGEQVYILLSLISKSFLGWLVFGGVNQPNKYTNT